MSVEIGQALDNAYRQGVIAFVSADDLLIPILDRINIHAEHGAMIVRYDGRTWHSVPMDRVKYIRRRVRS